MQIESIQGRWALVTGASRGIGRQIARGLAERGAHVVLHSRHRTHTDGLAEELLSLGVSVRQIDAELSSQPQVDDLVARALEETGGIDIVVNNAAIMTPYREDWLNFPAEDFRASFEVNVISLIRLSFAFIPGMRERGWGRIVNVTSGVADTPQMTAYAASKAVVDKFVADTAPTIAPWGIRITALDPGWLKTDMGGANAPGEVESVLPGALVPIVAADFPSGTVVRAQDYVGQTL